MRQISILKKLRLFSTFKKTINLNKIELEQTLNIRVDDAFRLYTVLNIPEEFIGEAYDLKKSDIDRISEGYIREYTSKLSGFLNQKVLSELYTFYESKKVDKHSYLIVVGFSMFKTDKYYNNLYYKVIPSVVVLSIISILLFIKFY
jgi:hypothetical protein